MLKDVLCIKIFRSLSRLVFWMLLPVGHNPTSVIEWSHSNLMSSTTDVELRVEPSIQKISSPISFSVVIHPNVRNNINSFVFLYGDGSRLQPSFDSSTTHIYRKRGM